MAVGYSRRTSDQPEPSACGCSASNACRCASTPSFRRPGSGAENVAGVVHDLGQQDLQHLTVAPAHLPHRGQRLGCRHLPGRQLDQGARWAHPVQRLVRAVVGVDGHRAVRLDQDQPGGHRQVRSEPTGVVDLAARNRPVAPGQPTREPVLTRLCTNSRSVARRAQQAPRPPRPLSSGHATAAVKARRTIRRPQRVRRGGHQGLPLPRLLADDPGRYAPRGGLAGRAQPALHQSGRRSAALAHRVLAATAVTRTAPPPGLHSMRLGDTGPWVVFLHGLFGSGKNWTTDRQGPRRRNRVLLVDLANHGRSSGPTSSPIRRWPRRSPMWWAGLESDEVPVRLVGHSMGGKVAMALALRRPTWSAAWWSWTSRRWPTSASAASPTTWPACAHWTWPRSRTEPRPTCPGTVRS